MKININYSKNNLAERILFLFLKKEKISKNGNLDTDVLASYFLHKETIDAVVKFVENLKLNNEELKNIVFPIQNKNEEMDKLISLITENIDKQKFDKFIDIFNYSEKIINEFDFSEFISKIENFYNHKIEEINVSFLPYAGNNTGISGGFGNSLMKNVVLLMSEDIIEGTDKHLIQYMCHEIAHLYETEIITKLMKDVLAKDEKSFISSWHLSRKVLGPTYIVREILANLFSNWKWSLCGSLYGYYWDQKLAPEDMGNRDMFLNGDFDLNYNQNYHRVYYMYAYLMKDTFWDYINNGKKIDENFFEVLKEKLLKKNGKF